ncbi:MAG: CPBP family intramembrane metalloprotease [Spirochaetaceae bacterium]|jgi:membrane protease YdiL (CAAX protease family)|nr:CPBP family intramembrane metalloprotease [Spirochaetaceae bacterium]
MKNIINWKLFFILLVLCVIASMLVIPYSLALSPNKIEITPLILLLSLVQNLVLFAVVVFWGLFFSKRVEMGAPVLQGFLEGKNKTKELKSLLAHSIGLGVLTGVLIVLISIPFSKTTPELQALDTSIPAWKSFLASFYGGIAEEILLRLFLVSLFVWITFKIKKSQDGKPLVFGIWLSIVLAAVIFGLGHLPATARITPLTVAIIIRAIVLNGIGGVVFGWLYWKRGLEAAIIAHFSTDIILYVIAPFVVSFFSFQI